MTTHPNYSLYTLDELQDVLENINKGAHPDRYQSALNELKLGFPNADMPDLHIDIQETENQPEEVGSDWQYPKTHFPKLKFGLRAAMFVVLVSIIALTLNHAVNLGVWQALFLSIVIVLAAVTPLVLVRQKGYLKFLDSFGTPITSMEFMKAPSIRVLIPFRKLNLSLIESFEFRNYYGNKIAKVNLLENDSSYKEELFIPWDENIDKVTDDFFSNEDTTY
ncbi:MAG: hypothetical protein HWE10_02415 [Gammaproteobacteria bacterium]|nr:hypothetical protein [Gammaproteobacteria bacterium]